MKKFIVYLLAIVMTVSLGFAVFYLVRDDEVISLSAAAIYKDKGDPFKIEVAHENKNPQTEIDIFTSDENIVSYDAGTDTFYANEGGVARINFRTTNVKFRNLWCDVIVGDGTIESPYYISTPEQLASIGMGEEIKVDGFGTGVYAGKKPYETYRSDMCYKLIDNIDASLVGEGYWVPLKNFSGRFDGNGYTISNVNVDKVSYVSAHSDIADFDATVFNTTHTGFFQTIEPSAVVYNVKFENYKASGQYTYFGTIAGINGGTIERVEVKDAYLNVDTTVLGGLVGVNTSSEQMIDETYNRTIAIIDRCSANITVGQKQIEAPNGEILDTVVGVKGTVGGLVGENRGGNIIYSYANGSVYFAGDDANAITYGGVVAINTFKTYTNKSEPVWTTLYSGANVRDTYSNIEMRMMVPAKVSDRFGGVIGINTDVVSGLYKDNANEEIVQNYIVGNYYNKSKLNVPQENITKDFIGIAEFIVGDNKINYGDIKTIAYGLTTEEMKVGTNFVSYNIDVLKYDENGNSLGLQPSEQLWLFDTVWGMDIDTNDGMPYLLYQLAYIEEAFNIIGTPMVVSKTTYTYKKEVSYPIEILDTDGVNDRIMTIHIGDIKKLQVNPTGLMLSWSTDNDAVATVDQSGVVTPLTTGVVKITAKSGDHQSSIRLIITDAIYDIICELSEIIIPQGMSYNVYALNARTEPIGGTIEYEIDNPTVAVIEGDNLRAITVNNGNNGSPCQLILKCGSIKHSIPVIVIPDTDKFVEIKLDRTTVVEEFSGSNIEGKIQILEAKCKNVDIKDSLTFTYVSADPDIVYVDNEGNYVIKGTGSTKIDVSVNTQGYASSTVSILFEIKLKDISDDTTLEELVFTRGAYTVKAGQKITIDHNEVTKEITWQSSNSQVAIVENGVVTGIKAGTVQITGKIKNDNGIYSSDVCEVTVYEDNISIDISADKSSVYLDEGENTIVTVTYSVTGTEDYDISYKNGSIVEIDDSEKGKIVLTCKESGTLEVWISAGDTKKNFVEIEIKKRVYNRYIKTVDDLLNINYFRNGQHMFELCNDIDLKGMEWTPIGTYDKPFTGTFQSLENMSYTISNFKVSNGVYNSKSDGTYAGLFGYVKDAKFMEINIANATINANGSSEKSYAGALVGYVDLSSSVVGCSVKDSTVTSNKYAGGLVGYISNASISNANNNTQITKVEVKGICIGGVVGYAGTGSLVSRSIVSGCEITTIVSSSDEYVGGIVGEIFGSTIENVRVDSGTKITGNSNRGTWVGGIVGIVREQSKITRAYNNNSTVTGYYAGGIGGYLNAGRTVTLQFKKDDSWDWFGSKDLYHAYVRAMISSSEGFEGVSDVEWCGVKSDVTVNGFFVGGLFGKINSGTVRNSYTQAKLVGTDNSSVLGGFAAYIKADSNFNNDGGTGNVGIVDYCYSACKFEGKGDWNYITQSFVHNQAVSNVRESGYVFNYVFENTVGDDARYSKGSSNTDYHDARKTTKEMQKAKTYTDKGFSGSSWALSDGSYPIHSDEF